MKINRDQSNRPDALLAWMESLGDATRLRLLRLLEKHELGVAELCDVLQLPQSTVSRHLKVLADQGWAGSSRRGTTNFYHMMTDALPEPAGRLWEVARGQTAGWATGEQDQLRVARVLRERQQDARTFFAGAAGEWDGMRAELYGGRFSLEAMLALLPADWVVADLGCGTGSIVAQLAGCVERVIGVDLSPEMLKAAKARVAGMKNVELRKGDLGHLPIETATCDAAVCVLALTYVEDPGKAVREMSRILKPGGRAVVVDLLPHDRDDFRRAMGQTTAGIAQEKMAGMLRESGFGKVEVKPLAAEPGAKGPALFLATGGR